MQFPSAAAAAFLLSSPLWLFCPSAVDAASELQIVSPPSLTRPGGYVHGDAVFGHPPYGSTVEMPVRYVNSTLCSPDDVDALDNSGEDPFFLMVERGDCTYVTKARNAQLHGASGLVVANHRCECGWTDNCSSEEPCQMYFSHMHDDGTGSDIRIPSVLLKKRDADAIKAEIRRGTDVVRMQLTFDVPSPDQKVEYQLWMNPLERSSDGHGQELIQDNWKHAAVELGARASFTPSMNFQSGLFLLVQSTIVSCFPFQFPLSDACDELCSENGRYCAYDPQGLLANSPITGADVVSEILRRLCVWEVYGRENGIGQEFWDYLAEFHQRCDPSDTLGESFADPACIALAMESAGIDAPAIDSCIADSGGLEQDVFNPIMEQQLMDGFEDAVTHTPYLFVNEVPVRGRITFATTFKAICSGFPQGSEPEICLSCSSSSAVEECVVAGGSQVQAATVAPANAIAKSVAGGADNGASAGVIAGSVIAVLFALVLVTFVLRRRHKQKKSRKAGANVREAECSPDIEEDQTSVTSQADEGEPKLT